MSKFAIILSGCGQHDGSETHETILTLLAMDQANIEWHAFAPEIKQPTVINHVTENEDKTTKRSVLEESARLVRGKIKPLSMANVTDYDAIVFPGGLGAVTTLCNWFEKQANFTFNSEVQRLIDDAVKHQIPMGFICIAPMMISKIYPGAQFTIGNDKTIAAQITDMGCKHIDCTADDVVVDEAHKIASTPANMLPTHIGEIFIGISKLIHVLQKMSH